MNNNVRIKNSNVHSSSLFQKVLAVFTMLFILVGAGLATISHSTEKVEAVDASKLVMCKILGEPAPQLYQYAQSSDLAFLLRSKSVVSSSQDKVDTGLNQILSIFGKDFNTINKNIIGYDPKVYNDTGETETDEENSDTEDKKKEKNYNQGVQVNPYDRFGVAGLKFTNYTGEWKYLVINACSDSSDINDPKAGYYYDDRKEPRSTWEYIKTSPDIRTQQFSKNFSLQFLSAILNVVANSLFFITKLIIVITIALVNFAFSDIITMMGIDELLAGDGSLFTTLYNGIFTPFIIIAFVLTALTMAMHLKREEPRKAIQTLARSIVLYIIAIVICLSPLFWISIPNKIAVAGQSILLTSLSQAMVSGDGICTTNIGEVKEVKIEAKGLNSTMEEQQDVLAKTSENLRSTIDCQFWQTFLLKPWSNAQFGTDWNTLWANDNIPDWAKKNYGNNNSTLGNLNAEMVGDASVPMGNETSINNWALYQLSTQTNVHVPTNHEGQPSKYENGVSNDWWRIVDALANYDEEEETVSSTHNSSLKKENSTNNKKNDNNSKSNWTLPAEGAITSPFGTRPGIASGFHHGVDIPNTCGVPVVSVTNGHIKGVGKDLYGGNYVFIYNSDGSSSFYHHLENNSTTVSEGQEVKAGQKIGTMGNTGLSFGCHLHFEVRPNQGNWFDFDSAIDPMNFMKSKGVTLGSGKLGDIVESSGKFVTGSVGSNITYAKPKNNPVHSTWDTWTGNNNITRIGIVISSVIIALVGVSAPLFFAFMSAMYAIGLTLLTAIAPLMLLFGCWSGKGWEICKDWLILLYKTVIGRIIIGFMLGLSLILTMTILSMINSIGWFRAMLILVLVSVLLFNARHKIMAMIKSFGGSSRMESVASQSVGKVQKIATTPIKTGANLAQSTIVGGIASKNAGGSFSSGAKSGATNKLRNIGYKINGTPIGNVKNSVMSSYEQAKSNQANGELTINEHQFCVSCGKDVYQEAKDTGKNFSGARTANGGILCEECYDDGVDPKARLFVFNQRILEKDIAKEKENKKSNDDYEKNKKIASKNKTNLLNINNNVQEFREQELDEYNKNFDKRKSQLDSKYSNNILNRISDPTIDGNYRAKLLESLSHGLAHDVVKHANNPDVKPEIPAYLKDYLDESTVNRAWDNGDYDYISSVYGASIFAYYVENIGEYIDRNVDEYIITLQQKIQKSLDNNAQNK